MSRIAKKPISIPSGVKVEYKSGNLVVQGPKGELSRVLPDVIKVETRDGQIIVEGDFNKKAVRMQAGLAHALIDNMIKGVSQGYVKELEIIGVGYRAQMQGGNLSLQLGFSHPVVYTAPQGIKVQTPKPNQIVIEGIDKEKVGDVAAQIRAILPPEPYKGKGIRYKGEYVRRKLGKAVTK